MTATLVLRRDGDAVPDRLLSPADRVALAFLLSRRTENTRSAYRTDLGHFWQWCADHDTDPLAVHQPHLDAFARDAERDGASAATIGRRLSTLASFYRYGQRQGIRADNPMQWVDRPPRSTESTTLGLDRDQARQLLAVAATAGPLDYALACLLLLNALRVSEAVGADADDLGEERGHRVLSVTVKGGRRRLVPLAARTARAVETHLAGRRDGPLLVGVKGGRLSRQQALTIVGRLGRLVAPDKRISPHSLRHTAATGALDAGVPIRDVQVMLGHADPKTTIRYDRARRDLDGHATYALTRWLADG